MSAPLVELDLPAVPESATVVRHAIVDALREVAVDRDAVVAMVSEAVANCAVHAYPAGEAGRVRVRAEVTDGVLDVVVSDDGVGVAPTESAGLGLGVPLMSDLADGVEVEGAGAGTRVTARFELFGPAGPHGRRVPRQPLGSARRRLARLLRVNR